MKSVRHGIHSSRSASSALVITMALLATLGCQRQGDAAFVAPPATEVAEHGEEIEDDLEIDWLVTNSLGGCTKATAAQLADVNAGNAKAAAFLKRCQEETGNSPWCDQLMRPNPESKESFFCTY